MQPDHHPEAPETKRRLLGLLEVSGLADRQCRAVDPIDTGGLSVTGAGRAAGTNLNVPLPPGSGHEAYLTAFDRVVLPALERFRPEFIVVCSGLDASAMDPLGRMLCTSETYRGMAARIVRASRSSCRWPDKICCRIKPR